MSRMGSRCDGHPNSDVGREGRRGRCKKTHGGGGWRPREAETCGPAGEAGGAGPGVLVMSCSRQVEQVSYSHVGTRRARLRGAAAGRGRSGAKRAKQGIFSS